VTADARGDRDVVVAVNVAVAASPRRYCVAAGQCPARGRMVELAVHPIDGVMARLAGRWEMRSNVIDRRLRLVVVVLVATDASRDRDVVVVVDVAIGAGPRWNRVAAR